MLLRTTMAPNSSLLQTSKGVIQYMRRVLLSRFTTHGFREDDEDDRMRLDALHALNTLSGRIWHMQTSQELKDHLNRDGDSFDTLTLAYYFYTNTQTTRSATKHLWCFLADIWSHEYPTSICHWITMDNKAAALV